MNLKEPQVLNVLCLLICIFCLAFTAGAAERIPITKVSGGENHTLVLTKDNTVWSCGMNRDGIFEEYRGMLGDGTDTHRSILVQVHDGDMNTPSTYLEDINDIAAGWVHSLALDANGFPWAWGSNSYGQLGNGEYGDDKLTAIKVHDGDMNTPSDYLENIDAISAGRSGHHSLAVDSNDFAWAWGYNDKGQLGVGVNDINDRYVPTQVLSGEQDPCDANSFLENIIAVSAGEDHSMALDANGFVWTWGNNRYSQFPSRRGQLGNGSTVEYSTTAVQVLSGEQDPCDSNSPLKNIVAVSAGWDHCLALEKLDANDPNCNGRVYAWGFNGSGRLGNNATACSNTPVLVLSGQQDPCDANSFLEDIIAVSAGDGQSMALDANGFVWTWGDNSFGQLGDGTEVSKSLTPVKVVDTNNTGYLENINAISAGYWHSLAVDTNSMAWSWGKNNLGQLGIGCLDSKNTPQLIPLYYLKVHNLTQDTWYSRIQPAIDDANNGDVIAAYEGYYCENIDLGVKTITVQSTNPDDWKVVSNTRIYGSSDNVVTFSNNPNSVLAGFTLTEGGSGVYCCNDSSLFITNCYIMDNPGSFADAGVYCSDSNLVVTKSIISGNGTYGIYEKSSAISIKNNCILNNGISCEYGVAGYGIYNKDSSHLIIENNWICDTGMNGGGYGDCYGIYLDSVDTVAVIRNNTVANNADCGIYRSGGSEPNISHCIIWNNDDDLYNCNATYSCIENNDTGQGNIYSDPCFVELSFAAWLAVYR